MVIHQQRNNIDGSQKFPSGHGTPKKKDQKKYHVSVLSVQRD
jgi:hypothetical protein